MWMHRLCVAGALTLSVTFLLNTEALPDNYNKRIRPNGTSLHPDDTTRVEVSLYIESLSTLSEIDMDFEVNMYIRQRWMDDRLRSPLNSSYGDKGMLLTADLDELWLPDLYIKNDKTSKKNDVTSLNALLRVYDDGTIVYSQRVTSTISCQMNLRCYPLDVQNCSILFASYSYTASELAMSWWPDEKPVDMNKRVELPTHDIGTVYNSNCTTTYNILGSYSCLSTTLSMSRRINYYLIGVFVPSALIVILSWFGFWIDKESIPGRISLSLLTILTMRGQIDGLVSQLPKVSYIKLMDIWLTGCLSFVFAGFLEFIIVNLLTVRERRQRNKWASFITDQGGTDEQIDSPGESAKSNGEENIWRILKPLLKIGNPAVVPGFSPGKKNEGINHLLAGGYSVASNSEPPDKNTPGKSGKQK